MYVDTDGVKFAFSVPGGGHCWLFSGLSDFGPAIECVTQSVGDVGNDPGTGQSGPAQSMRIDGYGAYSSTELFPMGGVPPELPTGGSIQIDMLWCTALTETEIECGAPTGDLQIVEGIAAVSRSDPATYPQVNAGFECGPVAGAQGAPVYVLAGSVECGEAEETMTSYLAVPIDGAHGQAHIVKIGNWECRLYSAAEAIETGIAFECSDPERRVVIPA